MNSRITALVCVAESTRPSPEVVGFKSEKRSDSSSCAQRYRRNTGRKYGAKCHRICTPYCERAQIDVRLAYKGALQGGNQKRTNPLAQLNIMNSVSWSMGRQRGAAPHSRALAWIRTDAPLRTVSILVRLNCPYIFLISEVGNEHRAHAH